MTKQWRRASEASSHQREPPSRTEAFERFYEATAPSILAYIRRHCGDRGAVDDVFQITYMKFLGSRLAGIPTARRARAYLYRIASNAIADHGRKLTRRRRLESALGKRPGTGPKPALPERIALRRALRKLSKREQQMLWLLYAEGFRHKEVASIMNLNRASIRVLAFRARKKLAGHLAGGAEANEESGK